MNRFVRSAGVADRLFGSIKLRDLRNKYSLLDDNEKTEQLLRIVSLVNGASNMVDLLAIGGSKYSGSLNPSFSKLLTDPKTDFYIIDQSATGMFERRTRVGL